jgi:hypothetical protein
MRRNRYWSLKMENEEEMEPLFLERKHFKFITFFGAALASIVVAICFESIVI